MCTGPWHQAAGSEQAADDQGCTVRRGVKEGQRRIGSKTHQPGSIGPLRDRDKGDSKSWMS